MILRRGTSYQSLKMAGIYHDMVKTVEKIEDDEKQIPFISLARGLL